MELNLRWMKTFNKIHLLASSEFTKTQFIDHDNDDIEEVYAENAHNENKKAGCSALEEAHRGTKHIY